MLNRITPKRGNEDFILHMGEKGWRISISQNLYIDWSDENKTYFKLDTKHRRLYKYLKDNEGRTFIRYGNRTGKL